MEFLYDFLATTVFVSFPKGGGGNVGPTKGLFPKGGGGWVGGFRADPNAAMNFLHDFQ